MLDLTAHIFSVLTQTDKNSAANTVQNLTSDVGHIINIPTRMGVLKALGLAAAVTGVAGQFTLDADQCITNAANCRALDGIGGLSGGGATSVFLPYYPEPQRSEILVRETARITTQKLRHDKGMLLNCFSMSPAEDFPLFYTLLLRRTSYSSQTMAPLSTC